MTGKKQQPDEDEYASFEFGENAAHAMFDGNCKITLADEMVEELVDLYHKSRRAASTS
jgi:hypothetical protein